MLQDHCRRDGKNIIRVKGGGDHNKIIVFQAVSQLLIVVTAAVTHAQVPYTLRRQKSLERCSEIG